MHRTLVIALWVAMIALPVSAQGLSDALAKRIKANPDRFLDDAAMLIAGFGGAGGISAAEVEQFIALERARGRAGALRRLLGADLDGDGAVTGPEMAVAVGAASATQRGRLLGLHRAADGNGDGTVSVAEVSSHAAATALQEFDERKAQAARAVLGFDGDADGRVTLPEVQRAIDRLAAAA